MDHSSLTLLPHTNSISACHAGECGVATAGLMNFAGGITVPNIFGMLLIYGLGLILAATILNRRRHNEMAEAAAAPTEDQELLNAVRARHTASERYVYPLPTAEKATVLRCLSSVTAETDGRFRVTNRADMARLARPDGVSNADWYRAMAAYHMTNTDFSVVNTANKAVAAIEYMETTPDDKPEALNQMRRAALQIAGLPILTVSRTTDLDEIADWLRGVLAQQA